MCVCVCLELGERERGIIYSKEKGDKGRGERRGGCVYRAKLWGRGSRK